jgi:hypothetical protein
VFILFIQALFSVNTRRIALLIEHGLWNWRAKMGQLGAMSVAEKQHTVKMRDLLSGNV